MGGIDRRAFLQAMGAGGALLATHAQGQAERDSMTKPNILVILVDDLGYGDLGSYGAGDLETPHLDQFVAEGMRFTQFYANCPVCSPTRASILTGRYPDLVGVPGVIRTHRHNSWGKLAEDAVLLPRVLKPMGYHSAIIGKWHLGLEEPDTPLDRDFDLFRGWLGDMMDDYVTHRRHGINYMRSGRETIDPEGHATDLFSRWAGEYIREQAGTDAPFFLYLAYNAPHTPIQPPAEWLDKVRKRNSGMSGKRAALAALIEHMDHGIGQVLAALDESGQRDNTLVVFVSDNGGQSNVGARNLPWREGKGTMYEGGIRVPMAVRWPGHVEAGTETNEIGLTMDIAATAAEAAGTRLPPWSEGVSLLPTLQGSGAMPRNRMLFWMRREGGRSFGGRCSYAARRGPWKLVQNTPFEACQLFNLDEDPKEANPLPERLTEYRELFDALQCHINQAGALAWAPDANPVHMEEE